MTILSDPVGLADAEAGLRMASAVPAASNFFMGILLLNRSVFFRSCSGAESRIHGIYCLILRTVMIPVSLEITRAVVARSVFH